MPVQKWGQAMWRDSLLASGLQASDFQCHHLIPSETIFAACFRSFFKDLRHEGFRPHDFETNGIALPCTEGAACTTRLPLHRGPHPRYSEIVAQRVASIEHRYRTSGQSNFDANLRIRWLQKGLKKALSQRKLVPLNRRDPLRPAASFSYIDQTAQSISDLIDPVSGN